MGGCHTFLKAALIAIIGSQPLMAVEKGARPEPASEDPAYRERFYEALELHQEGVAGDEDAVIEAQEILEELQAENPDDAIVRAFLGNLYTLRARDAIFYKKMDWLKKGISTLDEAVEAAPEDPDVRSVRAINSYQLPRMFGRRDVAEEDFLVLLEWAQNDPRRYSESLLRFVYYHAGQFEERKDEEQALLLYELALAVPGESVSDEEIRRAIEELD